jgi:hypothetical protein
MFKNTLLLILLGIIGWLGYREVETNGWPWQDKVVITSQEYWRFGRGSAGVRVEGQVHNYTAVRRQAEVSCIAETTGSVRPRAKATVSIGGGSTAYFETTIQTRTEVRNVRCKIDTWR